MLKTVGGAGGAVGYGMGGAEVLLRQSLQQQNKMKRQTRVAPIIAPGEVKIQWLKGTSLASSLASLVMVSSLWSKTSASNLPEILVRSLAMAAVTTSFSDCWNSCPRVLEQLSQGPGPVQPFRVDRDLLAVIGRDDVVHRSDVTAWVDPDSLT